MYKIRDLQFDYSRYFGGDEGITFKTKKEICEHLIAYHSIDCDMVEEQKLFDQGKIKECLEALCQFEWEVVKV
jgi:O-phosphoseryl-tRNA(Cys) synthetase